MILVIILLTLLVSALIMVHLDYRKKRLIMRGLTLDPKKYRIKQVESLFYPQYFWKEKWYYMTSLTEEQYTIFNRAKDYPVIYRHCSDEAKEVLYETEYYELYNAVKASRRMPHKYKNYSEIINL